MSETEAGTEEALSCRRNWAINATLALAMLLASLGTSIANIALPTLATALAAPFAEVQWVVVVYLAALTVSGLVAGRLGDIYGLRRMLLIGLGLFTVASVLCGIAPNLPSLLAGRALQGVGAAFLMVLSTALMREMAHEARAGRAMGLLGTVSALGTALGPSLGGLLIPITGWRGIFLVQAPLALVALLFAATVLPSTVPKGAKLKKRPPMPLSGLLSHLLVNLLVATVMMTTLVVGPFYLGLRLGLTAFGVGLVMSVGPVISIASGVPSGRLVDRYGSDRIVTIGLVFLTVGSVLLATLPNAIGTVGYVLAIVVLTPGYQLVQAANSTAALAYVSADRRGSVSGLLSLSRNIGLIVGASAMGAVFALGVGQQDLGHATPSAIASGMRLSFVLAAGLMVIAISITLVHRRRIVSP